MISTCTDWYVLRDKRMLIKEELMSQNTLKLKALDSLFKSKTFGKVVTKLNCRCLEYTFVPAFRIFKLV